MSKFFSKSIIPTVALAGLAGAFLVRVDPAEAKPMSCAARAQSCEQRCARNYSDFHICIYRTCTRQYNNCMGAGGGRRGLVANIRQPGPMASGLCSAMASVLALVMSTERLGRIAHSSASSGSGYCGGALPTAFKIFG
jgi:hypothetical protein